MSIDSTYNNHTKRQLSIWEKTDLVVPDGVILMLPAESDEPTELRQLGRNELDWDRFILVENNPKIHNRINGLYLRMGVPHVDSRDVLEVADSLTRHVSVGYAHLDYCVQYNSDSSSTLYSLAQCLSNNAHIRITQMTPGSRAQSFKSCVEINGLIGSLLNKWADLEVVTWKQNVQLNQLIHNDSICYGDPVIASWAALTLGPTSRCFEPNFHTIYKAQSLKMATGWFKCRVGTFPRSHIEEAMTNLEYFKTLLVMINPLIKNKLEDIIHD